MSATGPTRLVGPVVVAALALSIGACDVALPRHKKNARAERARFCLREHGALVTGDPKARPAAGDDNAPDHELIATVRGTMAFIAFYRSDARAKALEPGVRANAKRFKGLVVRDQNTTVVYTKKPSTDVRRRLENCVF